MRLYSARIEDFYDHVRDNTLADTIRYPGIPEYNTFNPNSAGIPREAGGGPSAMRARPDGVYASRRAPAMRAENCSSNFQAKECLSLLNEQIVAKNLILAKLGAAKARAEKSVIIVHGGPGTGKSVIALSPNPALRRIPREAGGGPSAMRARPDGAYASRRAPAMRAENFSRSFQANLLAELGLKGSQNNVRYACKSKPFREALLKTVGF